MKHAMIKIHTDRGKYKKKKKHTFSQPLKERKKVTESEISDIDADIATQDNG